MKYKFEDGQYSLMRGQEDSAHDGYEDVNVLTLVKTLKYAENLKPFLVKIINVDDDFTHVQPYVDQHVGPHMESKPEPKNADQP